MEQTDLIGGRYRVLKEIGRGAMGVVLLAEHVSLKRRVALKLIQGELAKYPELRARFDREARAAAKITSPYVVQMIDHGVTEKGEPFMAMEYLEGETLRTRLAARGSLTPTETAHVVTQLCRAMTKAHEAGLVHRDLKPENIFLARSDEDEVLKVLDFGVVKVTDALSLDNIPPTATGTMVGTPSYMSPEQAQGLKSVDYRSDLWSIGVIVFECLIGRRPFTARSLGPLVREITVDTIPTLSQAAGVDRLGPALEQWISKALSRDPAQRFTSARELGETFAKAAGSATALERDVATPGGHVDPQEALTVPRNGRIQPGGSDLETATTVLRPLTRRPARPETPQVGHREHPRYKYLVVGAVALGVLAVGIVYMAFFAR